MDPIRPFHIIENTGARPDRIADTRRMLERQAAATLDRHLINPEVWAFDGKVYVFLPGIFLVYDYHEFMATQRHT